jgi:ABC-type multidrug transport system fused ATPase/permease subunit
VPIILNKWCSCAQGTIRENIAYGFEKATDDQIIEAASAANAMAFIKKAPSGFKTLARSSHAQNEIK